MGGTGDYLGTRIIRQDSDPVAAVGVSLRWKLTTQISECHGDLGPGSYALRWTVGVDGLTTAANVEPMTAPRGCKTRAPSSASAPRWKRPSGSVRSMASRRRSKQSCARVSGPD